jgi:catechol 2,3-dioxygenase-like lactoylglutathione lyase family enzyme
MVDDVEEAVEFYTKNLGFEVKQENFPYFAWLTRDGAGLILSPPFGPGGAAKPMNDGSKPEAGGGWNRIIIDVDDLPAEVERLRKANVSFRNDIATGPGGSEILLNDPSGNPVELFQAAAESSKKAGSQH